MKQVKLIELWFLKDHSEKPIKTQGFKSRVKPDAYSNERDGYVFIDPKSGAFMVSRYENTVFETEKDALMEFEKQQKDYKSFLQKTIEKYTDELKRINQ